MLWPDDLGWPQDIGALAILDGNPLLDADGRFRIEAVRKAVETRLHVSRGSVKRLPATTWSRRTAVGRRTGLRHCRARAGPPLYPPWGRVAATRRHREAASAPVGSLSTCGGCGSYPACQEGRIGLYVKVHHSIADGVAGVATLGALLDASPHAVPGAGLPWCRRPAPSAGELLEDNLRRRRQEASAPSRRWPTR